MCFKIPEYKSKINFDVEKNIICLLNCKYVFICFVQCLQLQVIIFIFIIFFFIEATLGQYTGLPTKNKTSNTTLQEFFFYIHGLQHMSTLSSTPRH